jgi:hypothetical protein
MYYLLLVFGLLTASTGEKPAVADHKGPYVEFTQHPCRGFCPSYRLTFRQDGMVEYEGLRNVEKMGKTTFRLSRAERNRLKAGVKKANVWKYPETIDSEIADAPTATITVWAGKKKKSVTGSVDRPKPLLELERVIKELAEIHGLNVRDGVDPNAPPPATRRELIVKLKPEINAGNWIVQFQEIRLRLVRRVSAENTWIVAYDPAEIQEKTVVGMIKSTQGVIDVQPNGAPKERD